MDAKPVHPGARTVWTYEDYLQLPDDGRRYEIVEGELFELDAPTWDHQNVAGRLHALLLDYCDRTGNGEVGIAPIDVVLSKTAVVQPDVVYISRQRRSIIAAKVHGAPDLAVEVLTASDPGYDRRKKYESYQKNGIAWYWIVDPAERKLEIHRLVRGEYVAHGVYGGDETVRAPFPEGFELPLSRIWPRRPAEQ